MITEVLVAVTAASSHVLPRPQAGVTIPIGIALVALAVVWILRKLALLAFLAVVIAGLVFAYQGGAFDHYVDKGKQILHNQESGG